MRLWEAWEAWKDWKDWEEWEVWEVWVAKEVLLLLPSQRLKLTAAVAPTWTRRIRRMRPWEEWEEWEEREVWVAEEVLLLLPSPRLKLTAAVAWTWTRRIRRMRLWEEWEEWEVWEVWVAGEVLLLLPSPRLKLTAAVAPTWTRRTRRTRRIRRMRLWEAWEEWEVREGILIEIEVVDLVDVVDVVSAVGPNWIWLLTSPNHIQLGSELAYGGPLGLTASVSTRSNISPTIEQLRMSQSSLLSIRFNCYRFSQCKPLLSATAHPLCCSYHFIPARCRPPRSGARSQRHFPRQGAGSTSSSAERTARPPELSSAWPCRPF
jgi:hypothetical protein